MKYLVPLIPILLSSFVVGVYLQHSAEGISPTGEREVQLSFTSKAPGDRDKRVLFIIAANAGNVDNSFFDDWI
ncbi:MAG: hypothetical protein R6V27_10920 [Balneolaceae bacterium]